MRDDAVRIADGQDDRFYVIGKKALADAVAEAERQNLTPPGKMTAAALAADLLFQAVYSEAVETLGVIGALSGVAHAMGAQLACLPPPNRALIMRAFLADVVGHSKALATHMDPKEPT